MHDEERKMYGGENVEAKKVHAIGAPCGAGDECAIRQGLGRDLADRIDVPATGSTKARATSGRGAAMGVDARQNLV